MTRRTSAASPAATTQDAPTRPTPRDANGYALDDDGLPLNGPARARALAARVATDVIPPLPHEGIVIEAKSRPMVDAVKVVVAKKEVTYGTDSMPVVATDAILTRNFRATPVQNDRLDRNLDLPGYGARASGVSNERMVTSYEVEVQSSGAAGTAPAWMKLLEGCGMAAPVLSAGVSAAQVFAAAGVAATSLTQHHWQSDQRRKMVGSQGTFSMDFTAGAYPFIGFEWTGLLPAVPFDTNVAGVPNFASWLQPLEVNDANTDVTIDGYAAVLQSFRLTAGVTVALKNMVNSRYVRRGGHAVTATAVIEAPALATKDYLARLRDGALVAFMLQHGTVAGRIVQLDAAKAQITSIEESETDEIVMWTIAMAFTIDGGSPDLTITAR